MKREPSAPAFLMALAGVLAAGTASAITEQQLERALAKLTVQNAQKQVIARGSGFAWKETDWVVTSLHALQPNAYYQIERAQGQGVWRAVPIAHSLAHDLVLLELRSARCDTRNPSGPDCGRLAPNQRPGWKPYQPNETRAPNHREDVIAIGFYLDTPEAAEKDLKVGKISSLRRGIPREQAGKIDTAGLPDLDIPVIKFQGSLLPGYSGGPILDKSGRLVAIGDGGLEKGAADISWGIETKHLAQLAPSGGNYRLPGVIGTSDVHYAAATEEAKGAEGVRFGPYHFYYSKTRSLHEMLETSDNLDDLFRVLEEFPNYDYSSFRYEVYTDTVFGVVIALPQGWSLGSEKVLMSRDPTDRDPPTVMAMLTDEVSSVERALASSDPLGVLAGWVWPDPFEFLRDQSSCDVSTDGGVLATLWGDHGDTLDFAKVAVQGEQFLYGTAWIEDWVKAKEAESAAGCAERPVDCATENRAACSERCRWMHRMTALHLTSFANFEGTGVGCRKGGS